MPNLKLHNGKTVKAYSLNVCDRVTLWVSDEGFAFYHAKYKAKEIEFLYPWARWRYFYPLYLRNGLVSKVAAFLDTLPDAFKSRTFYQALRFDARDLQDTPAGV